MSKLSLFIKFVRASRWVYFLLPAIMILCILFAMPSFSQFDLKFDSPLAIGITSGMFIFVFFLAWLMLFLFYLPGFLFLKYFEKFISSISVNAKISELEKIMKKMKIFLLLSFLFNLIGVLWTYVDREKSDLLSLEPKTREAILLLEDKLDFLDFFYWPFPYLDNTGPLFVILALNYFFSIYKEKHVLKKELDEFV